MLSVFSKTKNQINHSLKSLRQRTTTLNKSKPMTKIKNNPKLKSIFLALFLSKILLSATFAQNKTDYEKVIAAIVEAINNQAPEQLERFLAPDFEMAGHRTPVANRLLPVMIRQLNEEVQDFKRVSRTESDGRLTLVYNFVYSRLGERTATFVFNENNLLIQAELLEARVYVKRGDSNEFTISEQEIITIPIEIRNGMPLAKATVNGESKTFIIDTGASVIILNSRYFRNDDDDRTALSEISDVHATHSGGLDVFQVQEFDFFGIRIEESSFATKNLAHLEQSLDTRIYGLIGYEVLRNHDLLFDHANNTLTLILPSATEKYLATRFQQSQIERIPIEMRNHIPVMRGTIGNHEFNIGFDSGAQGNLLNEEFLSLIEGHVSTMETIDVSGIVAIGSAQRGDIDKLSIGNKVFQNTSTIFMDMSHMNTEDSTIQLDGLIGYEILSRQRVLLSYQSRELIFID